MLHNYRDPITGKIHQIYDDEPPDDEDWEDEDEAQDDYDDWENEEASRAEAEYQRRYNEHLKWLYGG